MIAMFLRAHWLKIAIVAIVLAIVAFYQHRVDNLRADLATAQKNLSDEQLAHANLKGRQSDDRREFEKVTRETAERIYSEAVNENRTLKNNLDLSVAAGSGLRTQLASTVSAYRALRNASPAGSSPPDSDPLDLFAELLGSTDEAAAGYAAEATEARLRGSRCERFYDQVRAESLKGDQSGMRTDDQPADVVAP